MVGQAILTYNAQQQYYQQGPGRYFTPDSFNVDNPFCQSNQSNQDGMSVEQLRQFQETLEQLVKRIETLEQELKTMKQSG